MGALAECAADWRDAEAYCELLDAERSIFAWEWLRRDAAYRAAAAWQNDDGEQPPTGESHQLAPDPKHWGLHAFEPACLAAPLARPMWRRELHPHVLAAWRGEPQLESDGLDLRRVARTADVTTVTAAGVDHILISDGLRCLRLDVSGSSGRAGPLYLRYRLEGLASAERPLLTLRSLIGLSRIGRFSSAFHPRQTRAKRWILQLRAFDALTAGASQREIAAELISGTARGLHWRVREPSTRLQVQRLVRSARAMATGGYLRLLL